MNPISTHHSLAWALAASLLLHIAIPAVMWFTPLLYDDAPPHHRAERLLVRMVDEKTKVGFAIASRHGQVRPETPRMESRVTPLGPVPALATTLETTEDALRTGQTQAPRFKEPPQFTAVENYPRVLHFRMRLALAVSESGRIARIDILEMGPTPPDLRDAVLTELYNARMHPAQANGRAVSGRLELVVGTEPPPESVDDGPPVNLTRPQAAEN